MNQEDSEQDEANAMKQEDFSGAQNILWLDALPKYTNDS